MMDVNTKVTLYVITPNGYKTMNCRAIDYSVSENALTIECPEVSQLNTALSLIDAARANALDEVERLKTQITRMNAAVAMATTDLDAAKREIEYLQMTISQLRNTMSIQAGTSEVR